MTDPTPEERADTLAMSECPHWSEAVPFTCQSECPRCVGKEIRAAVKAEREHQRKVYKQFVAEAKENAVAAETERCASEADAYLRNNLRYTSPTMILISDTIDTIAQEIVAAIRAPTPEEPEEK